MLASLAGGEMSGGENSSLKNGVPICPHQTFLKRIEFVKILKITKEDLDKDSFFEILSDASPLKPDLQMEKEINKFGNLCCPYCKIVLTEQSFLGGKWQCRRCEKLLDFDTFRNFYSKKEK